MPECSKSESIKPLFVDATSLTHQNSAKFAMSHALIFGASGISGWAILSEITSYPTPNSFAKITGLSNRPLTLEQAYLPQDPRLNLVNGIDLTKPVSEVVQKLKDKVEDAHTISHVFFTGTHSLLHTRRTQEPDLTESSIHPNRRLRKLEESQHSAP